MDMCPILGDSQCDLAEGTIGTLMSAIMAGRT